ncbi:MAG: SDR family oxidoreductase [Promethearchaeota archaeon]
MKIMIAGASGGIGSFLTEKFDKKENDLILTYNTSREKIYKTKEALCTIFKCDFTIKQEVIDTFSKIESLDVLINVMGYVENNLICRMKEEEWDRVIDSNLKTVFFSCRYGIEKMVEYGHIINVSSILSCTGMIGATNYAASKGGVESFTKSFALECLHDRKVFVNAIALGYFKIGMGLDLNNKIEKITKEKIPMKDFGDPEEIYKLIKYIISSRYLVGQVIHLNGGLRV